MARDAQLKSREVNGDVRETTKEEQLLAAILAANEELLEALKQYDDMDRVAMERKVEYRSAKEARMDQRVSIVVRFFSVNLTLSFRSSRRL